MPALVPTLTASLAHADALFAAGRLPAARRSYGDLVERAQDKSDRATEVIARTMLAWCALRARDVDVAARGLAEAELHLDSGHTESNARFQRVGARLAVETHGPAGAREVVRAYLGWAEDEEHAEGILDACLLLAGLSEVEERVDWMERGIEAAVRGGATADLGRAYTELAAALDQLDQPEQALEAYKQALHWHREAAGDGVVSRATVAAEWAVGSAACRCEEWAQARDRLEAALPLAKASDDCADLVGWILADLARVYEAAGDIVAARHQLVAALEVAEEQDLASLWPARHSALLAQAEALELG